MERGGRDEEVVGRIVRFGVVLDLLPGWRCRRWKIDGRLGVEMVEDSPEATGESWGAAPVLSVKRLETVVVIWSDG